MAKKSSKQLFVCNSCGREYLQWQGRCDACGEWNTLAAISVSTAVASSWNGEAAAETPRPLSDASLKPEERLVTGLPEFDRVLGGGLVRGSVILVSGDPGVGKSTLLLQTAGKLTEQGQIVLYICGEESQSQIRARAERLGIAHDQIFVSSLVDVTAYAKIYTTLKPSLVVVDSVQTLYHPDFPSSPGSIVQLRECALVISKLARDFNTAHVLVGHVTKQGVVAGPRVLEHMVDAVLSFDAQSDRSYRILRAEKNRFGDATEVGVFEMTGQGFISVDNPASFFLAERQVAPGSSLTVLLEGNRPLVLEVQALANRSHFGYPKRASSGFDVNRLQLLLAILERHAGVAVGDYDVFINIVGGWKVREPAADLAVVTAVVSSLAGHPLPERLCLFGEVGLTGEIRRVTQHKKREESARRLGYDVLPFSPSLREVLAKTGVLVGGPTKRSAANKLAV